MNAMKKSAIAMAVTAAVGVAASAQADTTLYGSGRVSVDYQDVDIPGNLVEDPDASWDIVNNASRLGVRGSEDLGGGLSAIYQFEFGVDTTEGGNFNNNRPKWIGLKGGFGSVMIGTQWTPYYNALGIADVFNTDKFSFSTGNLNFLGPHRTDNTLAYVSPNFAGFEVQAALMMNGLQRGTLTTTGSNGGPANVDVPSPLPNVTEDIDAYNISGIYKNGPLFAGVTYVQLMGDNPPELGFDAGDRSVWGLGLGYTFGPVGLSLIYEDGDVFSGPLAIGSGSDNSEASNIYGNVSWTIGNLILRAGYGYIDWDPPGPEDAKLQNYIAGAQYNLSKRTRAWIEYLGRDGDDVLNNSNVVSIGMRHDF